MVTPDSALTHRRGSASPVWSTGRRGQPRTSRVQAACNSAGSMHRGDVLGALAQQGPSPRTATPRSTERRLADVPHNPLPNVEKLLINTPGAAPHWRTALS